jgi:hypothetical protein
MDDGNNQTIQRQEWDMLEDDPGCGKRGNEEEPPLRPIIVD